MRQRLHGKREGDRAGAGSAELGVDVQGHEAVFGEQLEIAEQIRPPLAAVELVRKRRESLGSRSAPPWRGS